MEEYGYLTLEGFQLNDQEFQEYGVTVTKIRADIITNVKTLNSITGDMLEP